MKFSIRDLLLLTVIVALVLGWWLREWQFAIQLGRANRWRNAAGALEAVLRADGAEVKWHFDSEVPEVECVLSGRERNYSSSHGSYSLEFFEPSADAADDEMPNSSAPAPKSS